MVVGVSKELGNKHFWSLPEGRRQRVLINLIAKGLDISSNKSVQELAELKQISLEERIEPAAVLLADASRGYIPDGPRGRRPILASSQNICRIIGARSYSEQRTWNRKLIKTRFDGISKLLIDSNLTASNPSDTNLNFGYADIRRGVYIPAGADKDASAAVGAFLGCGFLAPEANINLSGRSTDAEFFKLLKTKFEKAFNISGYYKVIPTNSKFPNGKKVDTSYCILLFNSKALFQYMSNLPRMTVNTIDDITAFADFNFSEVVKYFVGATGWIGKSGKKPFLQLTRHNIKKWYGLPRMQNLYSKGMLDANPYVKKSAEKSLAHWT
ncbi:MAG: hypothetical protein V1839_01885 [archaeon]